MRERTGGSVQLLLPVLWLSEILLAQFYLLVTSPLGLGDVTAILGLVYESTYQVGFVLKFLSLGVVVLSLAWLYTGDLLGGGTNAATTIVAAFGVAHGPLVYPLTVDLLNGVVGPLVTVGLTLFSVVVLLNCAFSPVGIRRFDRAE